MKRRASLTRIICAAIALGVLAAAYGTCYLDRVVVCFANGEQLPTFTYSCTNMIGNPVYTEDTATNAGVVSYYPFANQNAWMHSVYRVTVGGFGTLSRVFPCDSDVPDIYGGNGTLSYLGAGNNFTAVVYDACLGITYTSTPGSVTAWNGTQLIPYVTFTQSLFGGGQAGGTTLSCATN